MMVFVLCVILVGLVYIFKHKYAMIASLIDPRTSWERGYDYIKNMNEKIPITEAEWDEIEGNMFDFDDFDRGMQWAWFEILDTRKRLRQEACFNELSSIKINKD